MRIEFPGGWAVLSDRLTHARRMRIIRVLRLSASDDPGDLWAFLAEVTAAHVASWSLGEVDPVHGPSVDLLDGLEAAAVDVLSEAAIARWKGRADPNATGTPSESGS